MKKCAECGKTFKCNESCGKNKSIAKCSCPNCWLQEYPSLPDCLKVEQLITKERVEFLKARKRFWRIYDKIIDEEKVQFT